MPFSEKIVGFFCILFLFSAATYGAKATAFEQFSARFTRTTYGSSIIGAIRAKKDKLRIEYTQDGKQVILIVRFDKGVIWNIMNESQHYYEMKSADSKDIPRITYYESKKREVKKTGSADISGYPCDILVYHYKEQSLGEMTQWIARSLKYPIKIEFKKGSVLEYSEELSEIKTGKQDDRFFEVPKGYTQFILPPQFDSLMNK
ncbi:MAG: DUF4412 domain-containing protein [Chitinivibrionales bacterium]|nr:DUF4412 domain-containing protein [Chitinivibrionales bacterium]